MSNRTIFILTFAVLAGMGILLAMNVLSFLGGHPAGQTYLKYNDVRGIAVGHSGLLYTLNFQQQNDVIELINRSAPITEIKAGKRQQPNIEKIVVYLFGNQPPLTITPIAYVNENLVFSVPAWSHDGYFMDLSDGDFHKLLAQTYDP